MKDQLRDIGQALVEHSEQAEFTAQRSAIEVLFPYVFMAGKKMSLRAMSAWLAKAHGVELSPMALSRAMRAKVKHWRRIADDVEPAARTLADQADCGIEDVLFNQDLFEHLAGKRPEFKAVDEQDAREQLESYEDAVVTLRDRWYCYPVEARKECRRFLVDMDKTEPKRRTKK